MSNSGLTFLILVLRLHHLRLIDLAFFYIESPAQEIRNRKKMTDSSTERALRNSKDLKIDSTKQGQQQQDLANKDASASNNINAITTKSENPIDTALATHILTEASMSKKKSLCQICRKPILQNEKVRENCNFFFCHFHPSSI